MEQSCVECNSKELETQTSVIGRRRPSYIPTPWTIINRALDIADKVTNGRADWVQRFFSYSFIGGIAALVNLIIFSTVYHSLQMPGSYVSYNLIAQVISQVIAFEISLTVNFIPNDYFTFRHLAGHNRSWGARFLRYHITSITGFCLTMLIEFILTNGVHVLYFFSQAIALLLVFVYNFTFHHVFTYRHSRSNPPLESVSVAFEEEKEVVSPVVDTQGLIG